MIQRLTKINNIDLIEFLNRIPDKHEDMYVTENKERHYLKNNWSLIKKVLNKQEVYGLFDKEIKTIMIIVHEKGFRTYIKLLSENNKYTIDMLKFLKWNFSEIDLYLKLKKENTLSEQIKKTGFVMIGDRGKELLFFKKGIKQLTKVTPKDNYLTDIESRLY
jgi:hypothetical protein